MPKIKAKRSYLVYGSDGIPTAFVFAYRRVAQEEADRLNGKIIQRRKAVQYFDLLKRRPFMVKPVLPVQRKRRA